MIRFNKKYNIECPECGIRNRIKLSLYRSSHYCQYCKTLLVIEPGINELIEEDEWSGVVRKSGDIYVGRQHIGKTAYIYFLRNEGQPL